LYYKNDTLEKLEYKKNYLTVYCFNNLQSDNITVEMCYKVIDNQLQLVKGQITSSLYESMLVIGETPLLITNYADILAWEIDFFTETQNGDSFFILVEKKYCDSACIDYGRIYAVRYQGQIGDFSGYYYIDPQGNKDYYDFQGKSMRKAFLKSPLRYSHISSYFSSGRYHPILKIVRPHHGIDYVAPTGTPVSVIGDGTVTFAGWKGGYGRLVEITHSQRYKSRYGHLSRFGSGIKSGRRVSQGQIVGYVGTTGLSTGPHLHFELLQNGSWVNPLKIIPPRADPVKPEYFSDFTKDRDSLFKSLSTQN
jgi:murein DD-endopeptidase MepM/ murein hydrolase activator NlpD